mgnify:CR=1 FL=1
MGFSFIGFLGAAGARLIKSAVCREREFLADAAAVEFTRLARGLAGALKQAEQFTFTTSLRRTTSEELGHLFFNNACEHRLSDFAHTHPPLTERIRRLEPLIALELERARLHSAAAPSPAQPSLRADEALGRMNACGPARLEQASRLLAGWPEPLSQATRAPGPARAVIFALLCADATQPPPAILDLLRQAGESPLADEVLRLQPFARQLPRPARLPLAELAVPALREMSAAEFTRFDAVAPLARPRPVWEPWCSRPVLVTF